MFLMLYSQHALLHDARHVTPWCNAKHYISPFLQLRIAQSKEQNNHREIGNKRCYATELDWARQT